MQEVAQLSQFDEELYKVFPYIFTSVVCCTEWYFCPIICLARPILQC